MSSYDGPALVTGANSGIGLQLTLLLLREGWDVVAVIRSDFPQNQAEIQEALAHRRLRIYRTDLGQPESLKITLEEIVREEKRIEILFNNAGVAPPKLEVGPRGYDLAFEVNTLAPYLVTKGLLPLIKAGTKKTIVNTSSAAANMVRSISSKEMLHPTVFRVFSGPYGRSKLALSLWTQAWAEDLATHGIRMVSVDPGANTTAMNDPWRKSSAPLWIRLIQRLIQPTSADRCRASVPGGHGSFDWGCGCLYFW
jgi:NAD(P)-dependent dehydrogenase (short-subunit alcohol dehydrogenase family)